MPMSGKMMIQLLIYLYLEDLISCPNFPKSNYVLWPCKSNRYHFGQYASNYTHPRKPLCSASFGHIARGSGQLNGSKDRCEVSHVSLRKHGMHFLTRIPIQLTGNPSR
ncbi:hypothetical protein AVEN_22526-1 [Araneus ventricosus]|uniref:Secreted protein n=1 Tax=Araneus ventricosus TaxID=182803 RepID=A0A4Y2L694_ARAVE|nr:hypothetical protein AVEN_22526-1 [Araneus ventricosus]